MEQEEILPLHGSSECQCDQTSPSRVKDHCEGFYSIVSVAPFHLVVFGYTQMSKLALPVRLYY